MSSLHFVHPSKESGEFDTANAPLPQSTPEYCWVSDASFELNSSFMTSEALTIGWPNPIDEIESRDACSRVKATR